uniref:Uncharacterized protein n=1 Tax=Arion vulgaris TaxID=1028688 RepID=A0A0B7BSK2_9EUPU
MDLLNWIVLFQRAWLIVGMVLYSEMTTVYSACPRDMSTRANSCFTSYSFHFQNMQNSPNKLCCGVDVEILRAFCQSYSNAMECVKQMKKDCPEDTYHTINTILNNLNGVHAELHELCSDDSIIESYAMYQSCITLAGVKSEWCLQTHMNSSAGTNIKFLSRVTMKGMEQFCKDMINTVECVKNNVEMICGDEAAALVQVLIKPMIRQSTECDYSVIDAQQKFTKQPSHSRHAYISDGNRNSKSSSNHNHCDKIRSSSLGKIVFTVSYCSLIIWAIIYR